MKRQKRLWVVDLGEAITKIALGVPDENGVILVENYWIEKTPRDVFREGSPEKKMDLVVFLRDLFRNHHHWDELKLVLNHRAMILESFTFPMMSAEEVLEAIHWKMQVMIPEKFEDWQLDFLARERTDVFEYLGIDDKKLDVLGIGIPKNVLADYSGVFKRTKHDLKIIEPQFHGLGKFLINHGEKSNLILDIGYKSTRILFYVNGFLKEEHHIETDQANDLETFLAPIVEGVLESFQSPLSLARGFENKTIFLLGGGSLIPGVIGYLSEKINREIARLSIFGRDSEMFKFQKEIPEEDLCLLMPCLGGMLGWENKKE